jgi:hypothetical protein
MNDGGGAAYAAANTVTFHANGGKGLSVASKDVAVGKSYGALPQPYRVGYLFDGWWTAQIDGKLIASGARRAADDPSVLYAHWVDAEKKIKLEITKWKIKSKITVAYDLAVMSKTTHLIQCWGTPKKSFNRYGRRWVYGYGNKGLSPDLHAKMGTVTLASPAPANMVVPCRVDKANAGASIIWGDVSHLWFVCFKGKKTADVYGSFNIKVVKSTGKKAKVDVRIGDNKLSGIVRLAKPLNFQYGKSYKAAKKVTVAFSSNVTENNLTSGGAIKNNAAKVHELGFSYSYYDEQPRIYYNKGRYQKAIEIWGKPFRKSVKVTIKNKKLRFQGKTDKKNPIYKAAKKLIGKYSRSCNQTVDTAYRKSKVNNNPDYLQEDFNLPIDKAKTGDQIHEPGHAAIYIGNGKSINGSVTTHKTWIGNAPLRDSAYVSRPYSNLFRYQ